MERIAPINTILETRALIIDGDERSIIHPSQAGKLTFRHYHTEDQDTADVALYRKVERAITEDTRDLPPALTRRYLGQVGVSHAFVLTTWLGKDANLRDYAKQRHDITDVAEAVGRHPDYFDETDAVIMERFLEEFGKQPVRGTGLELAS